MKHSEYQRGYKQAIQAVEQKLIESMERHLHTRNGYLKVLNELIGYLHTQQMSDVFSDEEENISYVNPESEYEVHAEDLDIHEVLDVINQITEEFVKDIQAHPHIQLKIIKGGK